MKFNEDMIEEMKAIGISNKKEMFDFCSKHNICTQTYSRWYSKFIFDKIEANTDSTENSKETEGQPKTFIEINTDIPGIEEYKNEVKDYSCIKITCKKGLIEIPSALDISIIRKILGDIYD